MPKEDCRWRSLDPGNYDFRGNALATTEGKKTQCDDDNEPHPRSVGRRGLAPQIFSTGLPLEGNNPEPSRGRHRVMSPNIGKE